MKRYIALLLALLILTALLPGCANPGNNTTAAENQALTDCRLPNVDADYFELLCENCDITVYMENDGGRWLEFWLLSGKNLMGQSMTIETDLGTVLQVRFDYEFSEETMSLSTFMSYQGAKWDQMPQDEAAYLQARKSCEEAFQKQERDCPKLYKYRVAISFSDLGIEGDVLTEPVRIRTITATIGGRSKTYSVGNITFLPEKCSTSPGGLYLRGSGGMGMRAEPSENGQIKLHTVELTANENLVLQGVSFPGSSGVTVTKCILVVHAENGRAEKMEWDCQTPVQISAGSLLSVEFTVCDPAIANAMWGNAMRYVRLHYICDGTEYSVAMQHYYMLLADAFDIYAMKEDGVDTLGYYLKFKNVYSMG